MIQIFIILCVLGLIGTAIKSVLTLIGQILAGIAVVVVTIGLAFVHVILEAPEFCVLVVCGGVVCYFWNVDPVVGCTVFFGVFLSCLCVWFKEWWVREKTLKNLEQFGMLQIENKKRMWGKISKKKLAIVRKEEGYVISNSFYKSVTAALNSSNTAYEKEELKVLFRRQNPNFASKYVLPFANFLVKEDLLITMETEMGGKKYLTRQFVKDCEALFMREGAATTQEFTEICENAALTQVLHQESGQLAEFILKRMVKNGKINENEFSEHQESLYVAIDPPEDTKLIRHEVNM